MQVDSADGQRVMADRERVIEGDENWRLALR